MRHPARGLLKAALLAALLGLGACQGANPFGGKTERPHGPGTGTDDLRASPCACLLLPNAAPDADILREIGRLGPAGRG